MNTHEKLPESRAYKALEEMFQGGRPLIYICSPEERRTRVLLQQAAEKLFRNPVPIWEWSLTLGLLGPNNSREKLGAQAVLDLIAAHREPAIFQLKDFHPFMTEYPTSCLIGTPRLSTIAGSKRPMGEARAVALMPLPGSPAQPPPERCL